MSLLTLRPMKRVTPKVLPFHKVEARPELVRPLTEVIFDHVERAMILCEGNRELAAGRLGISRSTLFRYLNQIQRERAL